MKSIIMFVFTFSIFAAQTHKVDCNALAESSERTGKSIVKINESKKKESSKAARK